MRQEFICKHCSRSFVAYSGKRVYCSFTCKKENLQATTTTKCPTCRTEFVYHRCWPRKYCSLACAGRAYAVNQVNKITVKCDQCGVEIQRVPSRVTAYKNHFCGNTCAIEFRKGLRTGVPNIKNRGPRPKRQRRIVCACKECGKTFEIKMSHASKEGKYCSRRCKGIAQSREQKGMNSSLWRGGSKKKIDYGPNWKAQRRNARRRDGYACRRCGKTEQEIGCQLHVHHTKPFRFFGSANYRDANRLSNLACYCVSCHSVVEHATPSQLPLFPFTSEI